MLFVISPSIGTAIAKTASPDLLNALQHLADSRRCGLNEILGDRDVLRAISDCNHLSTSARAVYARLTEVSTQMRNLLNECDLYVFVTDQPSVFEREKISGKERIVLSVEHLARHQRLAQNPALLCENLEDCRFLTWIGKFYCEWKVLPNRLQFEERNGGGNTTAHVYETILDGRDTYCLCICDSDLKYEGDTSLGETARALLEVHGRRETTLACLHILECQEAENMIPASILSEVYLTDSIKLGASADVESIQNETAHELWRYFDIKNGLRTFELIHSSNAQFQTSWSRAFGSVADIMVGICGGCQGREKCEDKHDCTEYLARGLGTSILSDTIDSFFSSRSSSEVRRRVPSRMAAEWSAVGRLIWAWGTVGYRMAAC